MHTRRLSFVALMGLLAAGAAGQGIAACSNDDSAAPPDAGVDTGVADTGPAVDTGGPPTGCSGVVPVMTVLDDAGVNAIAPDWSCYGADAGFLALDGGDDAADADADADVDAADGATEVDASDSGPDASDAATVTDAQAQPDALAPDDAGTDAGTAPTYAVAVLDFSQNQAPTGATVNVFWGPSTNTTPAFSGLTVDADGIFRFTGDPPAGVHLISYSIGGTSTNPTFAGPEYPVYWDALPLLAPPAVAQGTSVAQNTFRALVSAVLGAEPPNPGLSALVADARDCQGREVQGMQFMLVDGMTGQAYPTGTSVGSARAFYVKGNLPDIQCTYTTTSPRSLWSMVNAPVNLGTNVAPHPYTIRALGRMTAADPQPVVIDENPVESYPGSINVLRVVRFGVNVAP